jgi:diadenosine tetraphosphate (Ap4A) HIT family hydrolase
MTPLYDLDAARSDDQRRRMAELEAAGICILCPEHRDAPAELEGEHWYVRRNDFPYAGTAAHFLIVPHRHVASFDELPDEAGAELWALRRALKARCPGPAVATVERSGDMRYNGGSIAHLHVHFVVLDHDPSETVRFKVSRSATPVAS